MSMKIFARSDVDEAVNPAVNALLQSGAGVYLVGGFVRDFIMGRKSKDQDFLITRLHTDRLIDILRSFGHTDVAGKSFGVIKFRPFGSHEVFDFAIPRRERSTGAKRADFLVDVDPFMPVEEDLHRRDFCFNSIAVNVADGTLIDPFGGRKDIADKIIRLVFSSAFVEDPTRMMRAVQFAARFGFRLDTALSLNMKANAFRISDEAPERTANEIAKLLTAEKPSRGLALMRSHGLLDRIMPELSQLSGIPQPERYHKYDVLSHCFMACDYIPIGSNRAKDKSKLVTLRLGALLHDTGKASALVYKDGVPTFVGHDEVGADINRDLLSRLRFSSVEQYKFDVGWIEHATRHHMFGCSTDDTLRAKRRLVAKVGRSNIFNQIRLRVADRLAKGMNVDVSEWLTFAKQIRLLRHGQKPVYDKKNLAVNGNDIMKHLSIRPGKRVGAILEGLFQAVLDNPELNTGEALLAMAKEMP